MTHGGVDRLLKNTSSILISCRDCGRARVWFEPDFRRAGFSPDATVKELGKRLFCPACREQGGRYRNIVIESYPAGQTSAAA